MRARLLIIFALIATGLLAGMVFHNLPIPCELGVVSDAVGGCLNCGEDINIWGIYQKFSLTSRLVYLTLMIMLLYVGWSFCARMFDLMHLRARVMQYYQQGHYTLLRVWKIYPKSTR